jgi:hypothetical protein
MWLARFACGVSIEIVSILVRRFSVDVEVVELLR